MQSVIGGMRGEEGGGLDRSRPPPERSLGPPAQPLAQDPPRWDPPAGLKPPPAAAGAALLVVTCDASELAISGIMSVECLISARAAAAARTQRIAPHRNASHASHAIATQTQTRNHDFPDGALPLILRYMFIYLYIYIYNTYIYIYIYKIKLGLTF